MQRGRMSNSYQHDTEEHSMNAADVLKYGHYTVLQTIACLDQTRWETPGACGVWSPKNIIAHLASFEHVLADVLNSFLDGGPTPTLDKFTRLPRQFNDDEVDLRMRLSVAETLAEYNGAVTRVLSSMGSIPTETVRQPGTLPWYGREYALDDLIVYQYYGHKREHSAQIAIFRDRQRH